MACIRRALRKVLAKNANKGVFRHRGGTREYIQTPALPESAFLAPAGTGLHKTHIIMVLRKQPAGSETCSRLLFI